MTLLRWAICYSMVGTLINGLHADGIVIYKNQSFHSDELAKILKYEKLENKGFVTWVTSAGNRTGFEKTQYFICIDLPKELPDDILTENDMHVLSAQVNEISGAAKKFKQAAPFVQASLTLLTDAQAKLRQGQIRVERRWLDRKEYESLLASRHAAEKQRRAAAEAKELEAQQMAIQLADSQAKKARQERENRRQAMVTELEGEISGLRNDVRTLEDKTAGLVRQLTELAAKHDE